jgi:hypothetical protein
MSARPDDVGEGDVGVELARGNEGARRFGSCLHGPIPFGVPFPDPRYPDVFGRVQVGVIYTGGSKIAEHGGDNPADRDVPILVYAPGTVHPGSSNQSVETTQVAPTIASPPRPGLATNHETRGCLRCLGGVAHSQMPRAHSSGPACGNVP